MMNWTSRARQSRLGYNDATEPMIVLCFKNDSAVSRTLPRLHEQRLQVQAVTRREQRCPRRSRKFDARASGAVRARERCTEASGSRNIIET